MGRAAKQVASSQTTAATATEAKTFAPMTNSFDTRKSCAPFDQGKTLVAVIELSQKTWLVGGIVPGLKRSPSKKLTGANKEGEMLRLLLRWRDEAIQSGQEIERIAVAFESGRDGFWLARWLRAQGIEAYVIHAASTAVSREHRRAKTDRLDIELLQRGFLGWLRGEVGHCKMVAIPSVEEEDCKRPGRERETLVSQCTRIVNGMKGDLARLGVSSFNPKLKKAPAKLDAVRTPEGVPIPPNTIAKLKRDMERLRQIKEQIQQIETVRLERIEKPPEEKAHVMIVLLARVLGMGVETADMPVHEALSRNLRDRGAVARLGGLTGSPDESGSRRREKGLARAGCARLRTGMIQLAWRMVMFQKDSALVQWFMVRTADGRSQTRKTMIVALARKLLIAFWRMVTTGEIPEGMILRPAAA
jgi:transposase